MSLPTKSRAFGRVIKSTRDDNYALLVETLWSKLSSNVIVNQLEAYYAELCSVVFEPEEIVAGAIGHIVNYGTFGKCCMLNNFWVDEKQRQHGLGRKIMDELSDYAKNKECKFIQLETFEWQTKPFYENCGFTTIATVSNPEGFREQEQYYMRKKLSY